jgi:hypothetical protein
MSLYEKNCWNIINCAFKKIEEGTIMEQVSLSVDLIMESCVKRGLIERRWWLVKGQKSNDKLVTLYE